LAPYIMEANSLWRKYLHHLAQNVVNSRAKFYKESV
jgi:hypothetical protein